MKILLSALVVSSLIGVSATIKPPPMGWNWWNEVAAKYKFWHPYPNETQVLDNAKALLSTGLAAKGWRYVNLDCGYSSGKRDPTTKKLVADPKLFPHGIPALSKAIRAQSSLLKFGIYTSGRQCCSPQGSDDGNIGFEAADTQQFIKEWGVTYIKNDDCGSTNASFLAMGEAINKSGVDVFYSVHAPWTHDGQGGLSPAVTSTFANCARTTADSRDDWRDILDRATTNNKYASVARGSGYYNDPDMLEIGVGNVTDAEGRSQLALWSLMKAPMLIGTDLTRASKATLETLGAEEVISVNQDALAVQGTIQQQGRDSMVWTGPLSGGCFAAVLLNLRDDTAPNTISLSWSHLWALDGTVVSSGASMHVRDLWLGKDLGVFADGTFNTTLAEPHANGMYRLCPRP